MEYASTKYLIRKLFQNKITPTPHGQLIAKLRMPMLIVLKLVCKSDSKEVHGNLYNPFFEKKVLRQRHHRARFSLLTLLLNLYRISSDHIWVPLFKEQNSKDSHNMPIYTCITMLHIVFHNTVHQNCTQPDTFESNYHLSMKGGRLLENKCRMLCAIYAH